MVISKEWSAFDRKFLIKKCINERWKTFHQYSGNQVNIGHWQKKDIESFCLKCPHLEEITMCLRTNITLQSWPMLASSWTSLQNLTIHCLPNFGGIFESVELHLTLPNLLRLYLTEDGEFNKQEREPSFLPDLEGCDKLKVAIFMHGFFRFSDDVIPGERLPLPPGLANINLMGSRFHEEFMNSITIKDLKKVLPGLKNLGPCKIPEHMLAPIL